MGQDTAAKKSTELVLDEAGSGLVSAPGTCEKGLEVLAYDLVEQGSLGLAALILATAEGPLGTECSEGIRASSVPPGARL